MYLDREIRIDVTVTPQRNFARLTVQIHLIHARNQSVTAFIRRPLAVFPDVMMNLHAVGICVVAGKFIQKERVGSRTRTGQPNQLLLLLGQLHRCKVHGVVCRRLSAPAQNPHKSQCKSCRVPFFHAAHLLLLLLYLQCSRFG